MRNKTIHSFVDRGVKYIFTEPIHSLIPLIYWHYSYFSRNRGTEDVSSLWFARPHWRPATKTKTALWRIVKFVGFPENTARRNVSPRLLSGRNDYIRSDCSEFDLSSSVSRRINRIDRRGSDTQIEANQLVVTCRKRRERRRQRFVATVCARPLGLNSITVIIVAVVIIIFVIITVDGVVGGLRARI